MILFAIPALLGVAYLHQKSQQSASTGIPSTQAGFTSASPSTKYPFKVPQAPRHDNQSQPWYGGPTIGTPQQVGAVVGDVGQAASGLSSLWDSLGLSGSTGDSTQSDFSIDDSGSTDSLTSDAAVSIDDTVDYGDESGSLDDSGSMYGEDV